MKFPLFGATREAPRPARVEPPPLEIATAAGGGDVARDAAPQAASEVLTWEEFQDVFSLPAAFGTFVVTPKLALQVSAVFGCIGLLSRVGSALPWKTFKQKDKFAEEAREHPNWSLLHDAPNDYQTSSVFREQLITRTLLDGQGYAHIFMTGGGSILSLEPRTDRECIAHFDGRQKTFRVTDPANQQQTLVPSSRIIDIPHFSYETERGLNTVSASARNAIALARMLEELQGRQVANGANPGGVIEDEKGGLTKAGTKNLLKSFNENFGGVHNAGRTFYLDGTKKYKAFQATNVDNQTLESRRMAIEEICRFYGVPPFMIGATDKTSSWGTGIEQQTLGFLLYTLQPLITKIEQEFNRKLFANPIFFSKMIVQDLLRGDSTARANFLTKMVLGGIMEPNEARAENGLPPHADGNGLFIPTNMMEAESTPVPLERSQQNV